MPYTVLWLTISCQLRVLVRERQQHIFSNSGKQTCPAPDLEPDTSRRLLLKLQSVETLPLLHVEETHSLMTPTLKTPFVFMTFFLAAHFNNTCLFDSFKY